MKCRSFIPLVFTSLLLACLPAALLTKEKEEIRESNFIRVT